MKNKATTPASTISPPTYRPQDQPARAAIQGVSTGAISPPRLAPVLKIPPATPECLPPASIAAAQYGPSELEANPSDRHNNVTVANVPVTFVPLEGGGDHRQ